MAEQLSEYANYELGESFFTIINDMIVQDGIPMTDVEDFGFVPPSWKKLADKPDKTPDEIQEVDKNYKDALKTLADSCILYMSIKLKKNNYIFNFEEYKRFIYMVNKNMTPKDFTTLTQYNNDLRTIFLKIANHGEPNGDNLIDNKDWTTFLYAVDLKTERNNKNEFVRFLLNGRITAMNYAVMYNLLKDNKDNMGSLKLRESYKNLYP